MKIIHVVAFLLGIALAQDSGNPSNDDGSILNDLSPAGNNPGGNNPGGNNPGGSPSNNGGSILDGILPGDNNLNGNNPAGNNPGGNNPGGNNPGGNNSGSNPSNNGGSILNNIIPTGNNPAGNNPGGAPSNNGGGTLNTDVLCPSGIYSNAQCCSGEEEGLQGDDCEAPSTTASDAAGLRSICAEAGKAARCCAVPIDGQEVLCTNA